MQLALERSKTWLTYIFSRREFKAEAVRADLVGKHLFTLVHVWSILVDHFCFACKVRRYHTEWSFGKALSHTEVLDVAEVKAKVHLI